MSDQACRSRRNAVAMAVACALGLSGCGGGSGNVRPTSPLPGGGGGSPPQALVVYAGSTMTVDAGESITRPIEMQTESMLDNAGTIGGNVETAVKPFAVDGGTRSQVRNHDGGSIKARGVAVALGSIGGLQNSSGGIVEGGDIAVTGSYGGRIQNEGAGTIIRSPNGMAIRITGNTGAVINSDGATISSGATAIHLEHGGSVSNHAGSTIESRGSTAGTCTVPGACAIFVASDEWVTSGNGGLTLENAGTIIGNVEMFPTVDNRVTLSPGGAIAGDLLMGYNALSSLTLVGDEGTSQRYSEAVTGATTFAGFMYKVGDGAWVIDNDDLNPHDLQIRSGELRIGTGGTRGWLGAPTVDITYGDLVFDRSDDVVFAGDIDGDHVVLNDGTLVQAGTGKLTLTGRVRPPAIRIERGILEIVSQGLGNTVGGAIENDARLLLSGPGNVDLGVISGTGSVTLDGPGGASIGAGSTYTGGTTINGGTLGSSGVIPGDVTVNGPGTLEGPAGVGGDLLNSGRVQLLDVDTIVDGNYEQASTATLGVRLGSKLEISGTATIDGGTLEVTGANQGYVGNTRTEVLTADGGVTGTFDELVKGEGVVFTSTTIGYDANSVWLDTTGFDIRYAAAGDGVGYTVASMGSAERVQAAFERLDGLGAAAPAGVTGAFLRAAGQFQRARTIRGAQASLRSLSGEIHASSAAMTLKALDESNLAVSQRFDALVDGRRGFGTWAHGMGTSGDMARAGFDDIDFQWRGWLVGSDLRIGNSGVAGFAFGQGRDAQAGGLSRNEGRGTHAVLYAGWIDAGWYAQGQAGAGHFQRQTARGILLGDQLYGVQGSHAGHYEFAYAEGGKRIGQGNGHLTPFVNLEYAVVDRGGFAEAGAGGFGLRSGANILQRAQAGIGVRAGHSWEFGDARGVDIGAHVQWQQTLHAEGEVFDASFVGIEQWQPLAGIGMSRGSALFGLSLDAALSRHAALGLRYDHAAGQHQRAQLVSLRLGVAF